MGPREVSTDDRKGYLQAVCDDDNQLHLPVGKRARKVSQPSSPFIHRFHRQAVAQVHTFGLEWGSVWIRAPYSPHSARVVPAQLLHLHRGVHLHMVRPRSLRSQASWQPVLVGRHAAS